MTTSSGSEPRNTSLDLGRGHDCRKIGGPICPMHLLDAMPDTRVAHKTSPRKAEVHPRSQVIFHLPVSQDTDRLLPAQKACAKFAMEPTREFCFASSSRKTTWRGGDAYDEPPPQGFGEPASFGTSGSGSKDEA
jgi:hypothetical protein